MEFKNKKLTSGILSVNLLMGIFNTVGIITSMVSNSVCCKAVKTVEEITTEVTQKIESLKNKYEILNINSTLQEVLNCETVVLISRN